MYAVSAFSSVRSFAAELPVAHCRVGPADGRRPSLTRPRALGYCAPAGGGSALSDDALGAPAGFSRLPDCGRRRDALPADVRARACLRGRVRACARARATRTRRSAASGLGPRLCRASRVGDARVPVESTHQYPGGEYSSIPLYWWMGKIVPLPVLHARPRVCVRARTPAPAPPRPGMRRRRCSPARLRSTAPHRHNAPLSVATPRMRVATELMPRRDTAQSVATRRNALRRAVATGTGAAA